MGEKKSFTGKALAKRSRGNDDDAHEHKKQKKSHHHKATAAEEEDDYYDDDDDDNDKGGNDAFGGNFSAARAKKRIRNIERRLRTGAAPLPATVQLDLERELAALRTQLEAREAHRQRAHMINKYHMLRFFERKKATRLEKQLERRLAAAEAAADAANDADADDDKKKKTKDKKDKKDKKKRKKENNTDGASDTIKTLRADLHIAHIDRLYTQYFPFLEPYVSLYPASSGGGHRESKTEETASDGEVNGQAGSESQSASSSAARALHAPRPPMWAVIEETLQTGGMAALEALRERRPGGHPATTAATTAVTATTTAATVGGKDHNKKATKAKASSKKDKDSDRLPPRRPRAPVPTEAAEDDDSDGGGFFEAA